MSEIKKVCVIGYGYWGKKLARKLNGLGALAAIHDIDVSRQEEAFRDYPKASFGVSGCDAVAIATPPETHYAIAKRSLESGLHVFCEKPLTTHYTEALALEILARDKGVRLQTGHIYLYNPGLQAIPFPTTKTEIHIRLYNVGGPPSSSTRDLIWAGMPHAVSIAVHLLGLPDSVCAGVALNRRKAILEWEHGNSKCYIDVADYFGRRQRSVSVLSPYHVWTFNADQPNRVTCASPQGVEDITVPGKEPLLAECEDFLMGEVLSDGMASKVVLVLSRFQQIVENLEKEGLQKDG